MRRTNNTSDLRFQLGAETLDLLRTQFDIPKKWQQAIEEIGNVEGGKTALALILQEWFGNGNRQVRIAIEQAAAIVYYRHQTSVPVVETIVCDDAGQFKLLTEKLALCWIHAGRHYEKLSPVVLGHAKLLDSFADEKRANPWCLIDKHFDAFQQTYDERFQGKYGFWRPVIERSVAAFLK